MQVRFPPGSPANVFLIEGEEVILNPPSVILKLIQDLNLSSKSLNHQITKSQRNLSASFHYGRDRKKVGRYRKTVLNHRVLNNSQLQTPLIFHLLHLWSRLLHLICYLSKVSNVFFKFSSELIGLLHIFLLINPSINRV